MCFVFPVKDLNLNGIRLYKSNEKVKSLFSEADDILGFALSNVMFNGMKKN